MSKSFLNFLLGIGFIVFLISSWAAGSLILAAFISWGWEGMHLIHWLGVLIGLSIIIPAYKLLDLFAKVQIGIEPAKLLVTLTLLIIWFLVPLFYGFNLDKLWCMEASIRGIELLSERCGI
jgi:hypothetical protein